MFADNGEDPERQARFSLPLFDGLVGRWNAWQNGIPPGREWRGYGAQNPRLLQAFGVLSAAYQTATDERRRAAAERSRKAQQMREWQDAQLAGRR